jgi:hypothetical protein
VPPSTEKAAPKAAPKGQGPNNATGNRLAALCHALQQGSAQGRAMKAAHGRAFQGLNCQGVLAPAPDATDEDGD